MAYLKPPAIETKIFNKLAMLSTLWDVHTLEVARGNGAHPQRVPVVPVEYDGSLFVVSARGESDWVKNVRKAGIVRVGRAGDRRDPEEAGDRIEGGVARRDRQVGPGPGRDVDR